MENNRQVYYGVLLYIDHGQMVRSKMMCPVIISEQYKETKRQYIEYMKHLLIEEIMSMLYINNIFDLDMLSMRANWRDEEMGQGEVRNVNDVFRQENYNKADIIASNFRRIVDKDIIIYLLICNQSVEYLKQENIQKDYIDSYEHKEYMSAIGNSSFLLKRRFRLKNIYYYNFISLYKPPMLENVTDLSFGYINCLSKSFNLLLSHVEDTRGEIFNKYLTEYLNTDNNDIIEIESPEINNEINSLNSFMERLNRGNIDMVKYADNGSHIKMNFAFGVIPEISYYIEGDKNVGNNRQ